MRKWYKKKYIIHLKLNIIRDILQGRMSELSFSSFSNSMKMKADVLLHVFRRTHQKKVQKLRDIAWAHKESLQDTKVRFHPRVLNLSQTVFNEDENRLLNMGLRFSMAIFNKSKIVENLIIAIETLFRTYRFQNLFPLRNNVISVLSRFKRSNFLRPNNLRGFNASLRSIKEKISANNLLVSKADKGNCVVIMNKEDYIQKSVYSIKNSSELINKIIDVRLDDNTLMASFDVKNLFTTVPLPQTLQVFKNLLIQSELSDEICNAVYGLTKLCLDQNFFVFDGKIYSQEDGLSIGNGLSPLYVDDIIIAFDGSREELLELLNWINSLHNNIEFTLEVEEDKSLNFLDLTIHRTNQGLAFDIFRKLTQTDHSIDNLSCHQLGHKLSAFRAYINRMFKSPLDSDRFSDEVAVLKHISAQNGYEPAIIDELITKHQNKMEIDQLHSSENRSTTLDKKYISIYGNISLKIGNLFRQYSDLQISFRSTNTLGQLLSHNKDPVHFLNKSGVYRLKCGDCNTLYVGRSGRSIISRINEHLTSFRVDNNNKSAFGVHLRVQSHNFNKEEDVKLLHN
ncbi:uncharacterized protein LOC123307033 [Coccinella septempunctata]|uniref:uncharacterized protein LOC123307033 n=1 Tax=Coccinella septempunctata TaxID=41139 RepID=UPI001D05F50E|nr:uncharacterized protein LOC123307033 [Coccinella septempunctata]